MSTYLQYVDILCLLNVLLNYVLLNKTFIKFFTVYLKIQNDLFLQ